MALIREQELPDTRLELRWRKLDPPEDGYTMFCEYLLVLGLDRLDIRGEHVSDDYELLFRKRARVLELGSTRTTGDSPLDMRRKEIRLPFRDSAHIRWDSKRLGDLPMFAVCDGWAMQINKGAGDVSTSAPSIGGAPLAATAMALVLAAECWSETRDGIGTFDGLLRAKARELLEGK